MRLWKWLDSASRSAHPLGDPLPWTPGVWQPAVQRPVWMCIRGYHLCRDRDLAGWIYETLWTAEARGERFEGDDKIVVEQARIIRRVDGWTEAVARTWAMDCAIRALPVLAVPDEPDRPVRDRLTAAVDLARPYATTDTGASRAVVHAAKAIMMAVDGLERTTTIYVRARTVAALVQRAVGPEAERSWQSRRLLALVGERIEEEDP